MKICLSSVLIFFLFIQNSFGQQPPPINNYYKPHKAPIVVCHHTDEIGNVNIPALIESGKIEKKSTLTVVPIYNAGFPEAAKTSIENVVIPVLSNLFESSIPIHISFNWQELAAGTIAQAVPDGLFSDFVNYVPIFGAAYPIALAEKIVGQEINGAGDPDIIVQINSANDYCFDCNSQGDVGQRFDFPTIMIHEIFHGLGFSAFIRQVSATEFEHFVSDESGTFTFPYNFFLEDGSGARNLDLALSSPELTQQLTGNNLFFDLPSRARAKVFAPTTFQGGSSVSHLDFNTYAQTSSALMTPSANLGNFIRDGGVANDMLLDLGWSFTSLIHEPMDLADQEPPNDQPLDVEVEVLSDAGFDPSLLLLHYSSDGFANQDSTVVFTHVSENTYSAQIPAPGVNMIVEYFISVQDNRAMPFTTPGKFLTGVQATFLHSFGPDNIAPVMSHVPVASVKTTDTGLELVVNADDFFIGIDEILVEWTLNGEAQAPVNLIFNSMEEFEGNRYEGILPFPRALTETDVIEYKITAIDASSLKNSAVLPADGFFSVTVIPVVEAVVSYFNDFDSPSDDFDGPNFGIGTSPGFNDGAIHSLHPYPNAGEGRTFDFTYELKLPVVIQDGADAFIQYDEVVLVEPGNPGTRFGDTEFWDYCIVEGKKFGENSWKPFLDGYDSGDNQNWFDLYANGIQPGSNDSQRSGNFTMFMERRIDLLANGNFAAGDTVFVRFRLFSDPFAVGWGWAIDNLIIQDRTIAVEDYVLQENFSLIPNPVNDNSVTVALDLESLSDRTDLNLYDLYGRRIYHANLDSRNRQIRHRINMEEFPPGIYIVNITFDNREMISKKLVRN